MKTTFYLFFCLLSLALEGLQMAIYWLPIRLIWGKNTLDYLLSHHATNTSFRAWLNNNLDR